MSHKVRQELFSSLPAIDGRGDIRDYDGQPVDTPITQDERDRYVKNVLFPDTVEAIRLGVLIPTVESHNHPDAIPDPLLHGQLDAVYLALRTQPIPHYVIIGDLLVDDELYAALDAGQLPGCSIEIARYGDFTGYGGGRVADYICAVTYNGSEPVAMPWLQRLDPDLTAAGSMPFLQFKRVDGRTPVQRAFVRDVAPADLDPKTIGGDAVDEKMMAALMEQIGALVDKKIADAMSGDAKADKADAATDAADAKQDAVDDLKKMGADVPGDAPAADADTIAEMRREFAAYKADRAKMSFAALGLPAEMRTELEADYVKLAATHGAEYATKLFARLKPATDAGNPQSPARPEPPKRTLFTMAQGGQPQVPMPDAQAMRNSGLSDADIKAHLELRKSRGA